MVPPGCIYAARQGEDREVAAVGAAADQRRVAGPAVPAAGRQRADRAGRRAGAAAGHGDPLVGQQPEDELVAAAPDGQPGQPVAGREELAAVVEVEGPDPVGGTAAQVAGTVGPPDLARAVRAAPAQDDVVEVVGAERGPPAGAACRGGGGRSRARSGAGCRARSRPAAASRHRATRRWPGHAPRCGRSRTPGAPAAGRRPARAPRRSAAPARARACARWPARSRRPARRPAGPHRWRCAPRRRRGRHPHRARSARRRRGSSGPLRCRRRPRWCRSAAGSSRGTRAATGRRPGWRSGTSRRAAGAASVRRRPAGRIRAARSGPGRSRRHRHRPRRSWPAVPDRPPPAGHRRPTRWSRARPGRPRWAGTAGSRWPRRRTPAGGRRPWRPTGRAASAALPPGRCRSSSTEPWAVPRSITTHSPGRSDIGVAA